MIKTGINFGIVAGWFTFLTVGDVIGIIGGVMGLIFTILRIQAWFSERKKRNLEIQLLELKLDKEKDSS